MRLRDGTKWCDCGILNSGANIRVFVGHTDYVASVAFHPAGEILASGSGDRTVRLWETYTGASIRTLAGHKGYVESVAFSPDGRTLASGSDNGSVRLWNVYRGGNIRTLDGHRGHVESLAFGPRGQILASAGRDKIGATMGCAQRRKPPRLPPRRAYGLR